MQNWKCTGMKENESLQGNNQLGTKFIISETEEHISFLNLPSRIIKLIVKGDVRNAGTGIT